MKKLLSLILTIVMLSTGILISGLPVSAASNTMWEYKYFKAATETDTKNYIYSNADFTGQNFYVAGDKLTYIEDGKIDGTAISDEAMFKISSGTITSWPKRNIDVSAKPVMNFSFNAYIPSGAQNVTREIQMQFAKQDTTKTGLEQYNNDTYGLLSYYISKASDGKVGYSSSNQKNVTTEVVTSGLALSTGEWHKVEIRAFTNNNRLKYALYIDNCIVMISTATASEISTADFGLAKMTVGSATGDTYIKDIKLGTEDYNPIYEPQAPLSNVPFNDITVTDAGALNSDKYGTLGTILQSSGQTSDHYKDNNYANAKYTKENGVLKTELTPSETDSATHALIQNMRKSLTDYFTSGQTKYMIMSYEVKIPSGTESSSRKQLWMLSNDSSGYVRSFTLNSEIKNKAVRFYIDDVADEDMTGEKSLTCTIESDKWYRIIYVLAVTNNDGKYNINVKGYAEDTAAEKTYQVYEASAAVNKPSDGTDFIGINQERTDVVTPAAASGTKIATYYDNIKMSIFDTDLSSGFLGLESISDRFAAANKIELGWNTAAKKAEVTVKKPTEANPMVIVAAYDNSGVLTAFEVCTVSDSADGTMISGSADFGSYSNIKTIKAFMFDGAANIKPLAYSNEKTLK